MTFGAVAFLLLAALSGPTKSDESLLGKLQETHPEAIWPQIMECEDCYPFAAGGPFLWGAWRVIDLECAGEYGAPDKAVDEDCIEYLEWSQSGLFHPAYRLRWKARHEDEVYRVDRPVFLGEVGALLGRAEKPPLFLMQRNMFGGEYNLVVAETGEDGSQKLTEYPLTCEDAPEDSWRRLGFRYHAGPGVNHWRDNYCEIRDLEGFRNLARRALKKKPVKLWEHIGDLPEKADTKNQEADGN